MAAKYNFPPIYENDTFEERHLEIKENGNPIDLTGSDIELIIMFGVNGRILKKMPTSLGVNVGEIVIDAWDVDIESYKYNYQLQITDSNQKTLTYLVGTFVVKNSFE